MMNRRTNTLLRQKASLIPMFDGIGDGILDRLFQISKIVKFNEEDVVLKAGKTVEDIYMILSGVCDMDYVCSENRVIKKELKATDVFGIEALFVPSLITNKVKAKTELVCIKTNVIELRADQEIINSLTPNMTRRLLVHLAESNNQVSKLVELTAHPEEDFEEEIPHIIIDKASKLTRLMLSTGKVVVISKIDERRLRRQEVSPEQLNDEFLSKIPHDSGFVIVQN